jgi:hypothetical protein
MADVNEAMADLLKEYAQHWSTELRIAKDGTVYFTDPTQRAPSPPSELQSVIYTNYPEIPHGLANGVLIEPEHKETHGAEIILESEWLKEGHELCVQFPKEMEPYVKLKNCYRKDGDYYIVPTENGGYFGAAVGIGKSVKEAEDMAIEVMESIECAELNCDASVFEKGEEQIEAGRAYGIDMA